MICTLCEDFTLSRDDSLCVSCGDELMSLFKPRSLEVDGVLVTCLFRYDTVVRDLILRAKVSNQRIATREMFRIGGNFIAAAAHERYGSPLKALPAPSSLWGRLRGRFDVAGLACCEWFDESQWLSTPLPGTLWRSKRAAQNFIQGQHMKGRVGVPFSNKIGGSFNEIAGAHHIVVVDDILTSGFTMKSTFSLLKSLGAQSLEGLVIASST